MRTRTRTLPLMAIAAAMLILIACGGDDSKAEKKTRDGAQTAVATAAAVATRESTPTAAAAAAGTAPAGSVRALNLDCGDNLKSFRFNGTLALQMPDAGGNAADPMALIASALSDVRYSGAYQAPDRSTMKIETPKESIFGGNALEFARIGATSYTKIGATGWQQSTGGGSPGDVLDELDPRALCKQLQENLKGDVPSRKEKVNGVDATRYDYDRKALERIGGILGAASGNGELPENAKLNIWVADKEKFPVKLTISGSGQQAGQRYSVDLELNVTDLNSNDVKVDAPR